MTKFNDAFTKKLWEQTLNEKLFTYMINFVDEEEGEYIEDESGVLDFFEHVGNRVLYSDAIQLASKWDSLDEMKQVSVAISRVGEYHASRFMILMDYLSKGVEK